MSESTSMAGKVCLVTGAAAGIGNQTALGLAKLGATVIALARDPVRGQKCVDELRTVSGNPNVELLLCDLASQQSIRDAAAPSPWYRSTAGCGIRCLPRQAISGSPHGVRS